MATKKITNKEAQRKQLEREAKEFSDGLHNFGAAAYSAALRYYAEHRRSPRALERFMRRLEA